MIKGIGIDIVEMDRIISLMKRKPQFPHKILTPLERNGLQNINESRRAEYVAGRFAAKEALSKALGTGVGKCFGWQDASIISNKKGAPKVILHVPHIYVTPHLSISHSRDYVVAQVVLEEIN